LLRSGDKMKVHSTILMNSSPLFQTMLSISMSEKQNKEIDLSKYTDIAVNKFIKYLYCCEKTFYFNDSIETWFNLLELTQIYKQPEYEVYVLDKILFNINNCTETAILYRCIVEKSIDPKTIKKIVDAVELRMYYSVQYFDKLIAKIKEKDGLTKYFKREIADDGTVKITVPKAVAMQIGIVEQVIDKLIVLEKNKRDEIMRRRQMTYSHKHGTTLDNVDEEDDVDEY
jgi:hypothetical protein